MIKEEDLSGEYLRYYNAMVHVSAGKGWTWEERRDWSLAKVQDLMDKRARKALAERKQMKLFGDEPK